MDTTTQRTPQPGSFQETGAAEYATCALRAPKIDPDHHRAPAAMAPGHILTAPHDVPVIIYQTRYMAYCRWHGRSPEAQLQHDRHMAPFIAWVGDRSGEWCQAMGRKRYWDSPFSTCEREAFAAWLEERVSAREAVSL
jgi:hypothetical protein